MKKITKNKFGKGLVSLTTITVLLFSILAGTFYYENNITANVARKISIDDKPVIPIKQVNDIKELNQLNEGFYEARNGFVFYLETFDTYIPLYIKVKNTEQQNGLFSVDADGNVGFVKTFGAEEEIIAEERTSGNENSITGGVTGMERVSGFATAPKEGEKVDFYTFLDGKWRFQDSEKVWLIAPDQSYPQRQWENKIKLEAEAKKSTSSPTPTTQSAPITTQAKIEQSGIVYKEGKFFLDLGDGTGVEATLDKEGGYTYTVDGKKYYYEPYSDKYYVESNGKWVDLSSPEKQLPTTSPLQYKQELSIPMVNTQLPTPSTSVSQALPTPTPQALPTPTAQPLPTPPSNVVSSIYDLKMGQSMLIDNQVYNRAQDGTVRKLEGATFENGAYKGGTWAVVPQTLWVKGTESTGKTVMYPVENVKNYDEATVDAKKLGLRDIQVILKPSSTETSQTTTTQFRVETRGDQKIITNDKLPVLVDPTWNDQQIQERVDRLNQQLSIQGEYETWRVKYNFPNDVNTKLLYKELKKKQLIAEVGEFDSNLFDAALGLPIGAQVGKSEKEKIQMPQPILMPGTQENSGYWKLPDGKITNDQKVVNEVIQKQYAEKALKDLGGTLIGVDENGIQLAKKGDTVYKLELKTGGGQFKQIDSPIYTIRETFGKEGNAINILTTYDTKTQKQTEIRITKGADFAVVDEETSKKAKEAANAGLNVEPKNLPSMEGSESSVTIKDKNGNIVAKDTFTWGENSNTKTSEQFRAAYFYDGKEITKEEFDKSKPEEKAKAQAIPEFLVSKQERETKNGKIVSTIYELSTKFDENKNPVRVGEATKRDIDGSIVEFVYFEIDSKGIKKEIVFDKDGKIIPGRSDSNTDFQKKADSARTASKVRSIISEVERVLTEFNGLGYYATLFFDDDSLLAWRDSVDRIFASAYLGTEYWASGICSTYLDGEEKGIAYAETPQGMAQVGAHVEATRSEPLIAQNSTEFLYKITFNVRNGDWENDPRAPEEMHINVVLKGQRTVTVFKQDQVVKRGSTFGKLGSSAIVKFSPNLFSEVCLTFDKIPLRWKISGNELCNTIVEASGSPTQLQKSQQNAKSATSTGAKEGELNDF